MTARLWASYYSAAVQGFGFNCDATGCGEADNDGFYVQAAYTFNGTTKIGGGYGESKQDADMMNPGWESDLWTVGVYHDVTSWLKVVAEYGNYSHDILGHDDVDTFSIRDPALVSLY